MMYSDEQPDEVALSVNRTCAPVLDDERSLYATLADYVAIARPDHWFKNGFMVVGVVLGYFYYPDLFSIGSLWKLLWGGGAVCLLASSNYVINEILDAPTDRRHPTKCNRPIPSGRITLSIAYAEWLLLGILGGVLAYVVNTRFFMAGMFLLLMGLIYNVRPFRSKEVPYCDVLSESVNNPIRLALGWFVVNGATMPPVSLLLFYWMVGAFLMATKRFAEFRSIDDPERAAGYRASFRYYNENSLLISMFFYATAGALFLGIFIVRYHLELILSIPLIAGFFAVYMHVALKKDSRSQAPEKLYRERGLMLYLIVCVLVFLGLMFVHIPVLYEWFNVEPASIRVLWEI